MDKKQYYKDLLYLFENTGMAGTAEVVPQEQIAETGSDLQDPNTGLGAGAEGIIPEDQQQMQMMQNPNMMGEIPMTMPEPPVDLTDDTAVMEKQKFVKLFELFEDLLGYGEAFYEGINAIDVGLLDEEIYKEMKTYANEVNEITEKIKEYLENVFNKEMYEKVLYTYIVFRTELITSIKALRRVLKLNNTENHDDISPKA